MVHWLPEEEEVVKEEEEAEEDEKGGMEENEEENLIKGPPCPPPRPLCGELIVAHLNLLHHLFLVAVLLLCGLAVLHRLVVALQALLRGAGGHDRLLLLLVAHLPRHHLAVLAVAVALGLALASPPLNLANFLGLKVAVLLLHWLREGVGELLAEALGGGLAVLLPDRPRCPVAVLPGDGPADRELGRLAAVLPGDPPLH